MEETVAIGCVVKLDRGFPLVRLEDGAELRCKHATSLVKGERVRAVIGDRVRVSFAERNDKALIVEVLPRSEVNMRRLERELVLAHETGAAVSVVLTKADLAESEDEVERVRERVRALVGADVETLVVSEAMPESVEAVRALVPEGTTSVLIGRSGVGKSSLVNLLVGRDVQETGTVRETDGAGRHTTVSREMVAIPHGGYVVDMPGVRGLGLWDADAGIGVAFADVEELAEQCRFRDCKHENEPGCAVRAAVERGDLARERFESYVSLKRETEVVRERREQARWMQREQAQAGSRGSRRSGSAAGTGGSAGGRKTSAASSKMRRNKSGRGSGGSSWRKYGQ